MTNEQLTAKFNPANAANLTPEDLEIMRNLTDDQIDVLAKTFPNQPNRRTYLRLYDARLKPDKQLYQLSTWQNLRNVRKFSNAKYLQPFDFLLAGNKVQNTGTPKKVAATAAPRRTVVDLTATEAADLLKQTMGGDKNVTNVTSNAGSGPKKPAASKAKTPVNKLKAVKDENVDNGGVPPDQDFTGGQE